MPEKVTVMNVRTSRAPCLNQVRVSGNCDSGSGVRCSAGTGSEGESFSGKGKVGIVNSLQFTVVSHCSCLDKCAVPAGFYYLNMECLNIDLLGKLCLNMDLLCEKSSFTASTGAGSCSVHPLAPGRVQAHETERQSCHLCRDPACGL